MTSINIKGALINWKSKEIAYTSKVLWEAYKNFFFQRNELNYKTNKYRKIQAQTQGIC